MMLPPCPPLVQARSPATPFWRRSTGPTTHGPPQLFPPLQAAPALVYSTPVSEQGAPGADCSLHGAALLAPYPRLEPLQLKRLAARRHATTFCYDFPTVFENALRDIWWAGVYEVGMLCMW